MRELWWEVLGADPVGAGGHGQVAVGTGEHRRLRAAIAERFKVRLPDRDRAGQVGFAAQLEELRRALLSKALGDKHPAATQGGGS